MTRTWKQIIQTLLDNSRPIVKGKDGTVIKVVKPSVWNQAITDMNKKGLIDEWYMNDTFVWFKEHLNVGYYPRGMALAKSKLILISEGSERDESLVVHEYGHVLGYGHTHPINPNIMNPIDQLRVTDGDKITDRFKENFPEYYEKVLVLSERERVIPVAIALGIILFGVMG